MIRILRHALVGCIFFVLGIHEYIAQARGSAQQLFSELREWCDLAGPYQVFALTLARHTLIAFLFNEAVRFLLTTCILLALIHAVPYLLEILVETFDLHLVMLHLGAELLFRSMVAELGELLLESPHLPIQSVTVLLRLVQPLLVTLVCLLEQQLVRLAADVALEVVLISHTCCKLC